MKLIGPLIAGVAGAENGTADLFQRGTGTRANWYRDFEGTDIVTDGLPIDLDANGGAEVYVNELADVVVKNTFLVTVRAFVAGDAAPCVEVRSVAFTGQDYQSAVAAPGNPTTLKSVLDRWLTSAGTGATAALSAIDWKVMFGGVATTLQTALASLFGLVVNVKEPRFNGGAKGDGATDDTVAIQAALDYAATLGFTDIEGSTVYFPAGKYIISDQLTVPGKNVNLRGAGSHAVEIELDDAVGEVLEFASGTDLWRSVQGITFVIPAGTATSFTARGLVYWRDCRFVYSGEERLFDVAANSQLVIEDSEIDAETVSDDCILVRSILGSKTVLRGNTIKIGPKQVTVFQGYKLQLLENEFDNSSREAGSYDDVYIVDPYASGGSVEREIVALDNKLGRYEDDNDDIYLFGTTTLTSGNVLIEEHNIFNDVDAFFGVPILSVTNIELGFRDTVELGCSPGAAVETWKAQNWKGTVGSGTVTVSGSIPQAEIILTFVNETVGTDQIPTLAGNIEASAAFKSDNVYVDTTRSGVFKCILVGSAWKWRQVGDHVDVGI